MVKTKLNSILLSTLILLILIYGKVIKLPKSDLITLAVLNETSSFNGKVISNPVKSSDKYYSVDIKIHEMTSSDNKLFSAEGISKVLIPVSIIEAYYPDRLFSKNKKSKNLLPVEQGINIKAKTKQLKTSEQNFLIVDSIESLSYENSLHGKFLKIRGYCRIQFKRLMKDWGRAGGFLLALLSGSKEYLDQKLSNTFRLSGLSHILALSGMHLSLISSMAGIIENKSALKKIGLLFRILTILLFVWFAGISPSLFRALVSCLIVSACTFLNIPEKDSITLLSTTFLIHAGFRPEDLFNLAFLLSYCALSGILLFNGLIKSLVSGFAPGYAGESFSSSLAANIFTSPVSIKFFGYYSPGGIICTMCVSPLITVFLYAGIACMLICFLIPDLSHFASLLMNFVYIIITKIVDFWRFIPVISLTDA